MLRGATWPIIHLKAGQWSCLGHARAHMLCSCPAMTVHQAGCAQLRDMHARMVVVMHLAWPMHGIVARTTASSGLAARGPLLPQPHPVSQAHSSTTPFSAWPVT